MSLSGKVAVVTGAARGCGRGIALQLAQAGCTLFLTDLKPAENSERVPYLPTLEETAEECRSRGAECHPYYVDHSDTKQVEDFFNTLGEITNNHLDILVNNAFAGVSSCGSNDKRKFFEKNPNLWDDVNNVGLRNNYYCCVYGTRIMSKNGMEGLIINISSLGGIMYLFNVPYGTGKMAVDRMTSDIAHELQNTQITAISLWPGAVRTELIINMLEQSSGTWGKSSEYAGKAIVELACDKKRKIWNGATVTSTDIGKYYQFRDIDGRNPRSVRCLKDLLMLSGHFSLANWCPEWVNLPGWAITLWQNKIAH